MDIRDFGFDPQPIEVFDSSMLKDFIDCPSMFYLRHILGLRPASLDPSYDAKFDWGTCWHHVLWVLQKTEGSREERTIAALSALDQNYPEYITPTTDKYKRSKERMIQALFGYMDKWYEEDEKNLETLRHEQFFDQYSEEDDLRWCGRIDSIRRRNHTSRIVVWDYKTASVMGESYFDQHEIGFQFPGYAWATSGMFGQPVLEVVVDVMYMITAKNEFFRKTFMYDAARIQEWVRNVKFWIDKIKALQESSLFDPEAWGKNWNECTRYGRCSFFNVHSISPKGSARLNILQQNYRVERWDPSAMED